jgi:hypothetical protein
MYDILCVQIPNCIDNLYRIKLYCVFVKRSFLLEKLSELPALDKIHNEEQNVRIVETKFHLHQVRVIVCLQDITLEQCHFKNIII